MICTLAADPCRFVRTSAGVAQGRGTEQRPSTTNQRSHTMGAITTTNTIAAAAPFGYAVVQQHRGSNIMMPTAATLAGPPSTGRSPTPTRRRRATSSPPRSAC